MYEKKKCQRGTMKTDFSCTFIFASPCASILNSIGCEPDGAALGGTCTRTATARTLALIAKGDEVLDWREMLARHEAGQVRLIEGSDHALSDFDLYKAQILEFLRLG